MNLPETASFAEFAGIARVKRSYVTQLKADGRLVLTDDRKRVRVAESLARIEATRDPSKAAVAARHAADRAAADTSTAAPGTIAPPPQSGAVDDGSDGAPVSTGYAYWRERTEQAKALAAERENSVAEGKLLYANETIGVVSAAVTTLRTRLEAMRDVLAPQVAAISDEGQVRALLAEAIEHTLEEAARQFSALAKEAA